MKETYSGREEYTGQEKSMYKGKEARKSNMPLETSNFGLTRGVMFVELQ